MQMNYARVLYKDPGATLGDLRESLDTTVKAERIARRVLGSAHPEVVNIENCLGTSRIVLAAHPDAS